MIATELSSDISKIKTPKVSVIIAVYNTENYLRQCLDSALQQTLTDIEIICVNDGSSDNSGNILNQYAQRDGRIKIITQNNQGQAVARNNAIKIARGKYLFFLDSDDYIDSNTLFILYDFSEKNHLQLLQFSGVTFKENGLFEKNLYWDNPDIPYHLYNSVFSFNEIRQIAPLLPSSTCLNFWLRSFIVKNKILFPAGIFFEDNIFFLKAVTKANRISRISDKLYYRRIHTQSTTANFDQHIKDFLEMCSLAFAYVRKNHFPYATRRAYEQHYYNLLLSSVKKYFGTDKSEIIQKAKKVLSMYTLPDPFVLPRHEIISPEDPKILPVISIIMPVKTKPWFLKQALSSLLKQTFSDFEIICVCDGENACVDILKDFSQKDDRVKPFFLKESHGAGYCRNIGIQKASGMYIQFLDSDDFFDAHMLKEMYQQAEKCHADITLCDAKTYHQQTKIVENSSLLKLKFMNGEVFSKDTVENIFEVTPACIWNRLYRASLIHKNALTFQTLSSSNDTGFGLLSLLCANRITFVNKPFVYYRIAQADSTTSERNIFNFLKVCQFVLENLKKVGLTKYKKLLDRPFRGSMYYELSFPRKIEQKYDLIRSGLKYLLPKTRTHFAPFLKELPISVISVIQSHKDVKAVLDSVYFQKFQLFDWTIISLLSQPELDLWAADSLARADHIVYTSPDALEKTLHQTLPKTDGKYLFVLNQEEIYDETILKTLAYMDKTSPIVAGVHASLLDTQMIFNGYSCLFLKEDPQTEQRIIAYLSHQLDVQNIPSVQHLNRIITFSGELK